MTTLEFGIRYRRRDGSEYDRFSDDLTESGARQMVAASTRLRHHRDATLPVAALVRDVGEARTLTEEKP